MEPAGKFRMLPEAVAVAAGIHDVAMMDQPIDQRGGDHFVAAYRAPFLKAFVTRQGR